MKLDKITEIWDNKVIPSLWKIAGWTIAILMLMGLGTPGFIILMVIVGLKIRKAIKKNKE